MKQPRKSPRANFLSYDAGDFFITICTKNMYCHFGYIYNEQMYYSRLGEFAHNQLVQSYGKLSKIGLLHHVVMPNHIHILLRIFSTNCDDEDFDETLRNPNPSQRSNLNCPRHVTALSTYVTSLKGVVTKFAHAHNIDFAWQSRYHDHKIRGPRDLHYILEYINNNVSRWRKDCFFRGE